MNICRIATVPFFVMNHLRDQIKHNVKAGHKVFVISSPGDDIEAFCEGLGAWYHQVDICRNISPVEDVRALISLIRFFRLNRTDIVHSVTPKAGLLSAIAARISKIPIRLHTFTGQRWAKLSGPVRLISKACDRIIVKLSTQCYADSHSQVEYMVKHGICKSGKVRVLGFGSLGGVNLKRFDRKRWRPFNEQIRNEIGIPLSSKVITFVGRVTKDKGVCELVDGVIQLSKELYEIQLILVGPLEPQLDPLPEETLEKIQKNRNIHMVGYYKEPEKYLSISDLFVIPSYREGFGNVVLEAAAMGIPAIGTRIPGLVDSIVDNETGILVPPKDAAAIAAAMHSLLADEDKRIKMGRAARKRVQQYFDREYVNELVLKEYNTLYMHWLQHG
ncbi:MAG: glycosyltransferase family 4 protein [Thermodesulfobacteriota bacterium]